MEVRRRAMVVLPEEETPERARIRGVWVGGWDMVAVEVIELEGRRMEF